MDTMRTGIIPYTPDHSDEIRKLNYEWLEKYFRVEPVDASMLADPQGEIIDKGGYIYYATLDGQISGTASLLKIDEHTFELGKMAVTAGAQGHGLGKLLLDHCIRQAAGLGIKRLILYSNRQLIPALTLYKKFGFAEMPMEPGHYDRANIKMEKYLP